MAFTDRSEPCAPWADPAQMCCAGVPAPTVDCNGNPVPSPTFPWTDADYVDMASSILHRATHYKYPGVCSVDLWPCVSCYGQCHSGCFCGRYDALCLSWDLPLVAVTQITIDGVVMPPADYRVDDQKHIVRLDGKAWPCCNNLGVTATTAVGAEIVVTADMGRPVPLILQAAALELACDLKRACTGQPCALPANVTGLQRRGVSMEMVARSVWLKEGMTGNAMIDYALSVFGKVTPGTFVNPAEVAGCRAKRVGT